MMCLLDNDVQCKLRTTLNLMSFLSASCFLLQYVAILQLFPGFCLYEMFWNWYSSCIEFVSCLPVST